MNYDDDIRKTFNDILCEDSWFALLESINDFDLLRLSVEFLRKSTDRLDNDLDNKEINEEYIKLKFIIEQLEKIIKNYV